MTATIQDTIERSIVLPNSRARVWEALTTPAQFSQWFGHFGSSSWSRVRHIHMDFGEWGVHRGRVEIVEPMDRVAYRWTHEGKEWDAAIPIDDVPSTLIEFFLADDGDGTKLTVIESGFASLPEEIRESSLLNNTQGWEEQMGNIQAFLASAT